MPNVSKERSILRYPRLDTVLMVEKAIKKHSGTYKKKALWEHLPKKAMYQTYCVIIDYLTHSGKIGIDRVGHICWIWNPELARYYYNRKDLSVESALNPENLHLWREKRLEEPKQHAPHAIALEGPVRQRRVQESVHRTATRR